MSPEISADAPSLSSAFTPKPETLIVEAPEFALAGMNVTAEPTVSAVSAGLGATT